VVVSPPPHRAAFDQDRAHLRAGLVAGRPAVGAWRRGLGRAGGGADGVLTSYREAGEAVAVAATLQWPEPVVAASDLLVYRVLLQNRAALADVVAGGVGGLASARGGAAPLVETLAAWFDTGNNLAATARALHLSVRAVAYRLQRVRELTGLDPDSPADRFTLQVAVLGQRLLSRATDDTQPRQPSA
ncbi:MAG: PucR family transcriptional regulator, partial [Jatrophihabitans sp.]|uniref:PucR family transcriptional regulator n=1 Tax=Jatrophihabitans sp. TaxID=1932789 RepID=UPI003F8227D5